MITAVFFPFDLAGTGRECAFDASHGGRPFTLSPTGTHLSGMAAGVVELRAKRAAGAQIAAAPRGPMQRRKRHFGGPLSAPVQDNAAARPLPS